MLGVTDVRFIGLCDGAGYDVDELLRGIARTVGEFKPDVIFAPDQDVDSECHADHLNVGRCARQIACFAPYGGIMAGYEAESAPVKVLAYYMTARPNTYVASGGYIRRQLDAVFSCHKTQFPDGSADAKAIALYLKIRAADFGLRSLKGKAEGFRAMSAFRCTVCPRPDYKKHIKTPETRCLRCFWRYKLCFTWLLRFPSRRLRQPRRRPLRPPLPQAHGRRLCRPASWADASRNSISLGIAYFAMCLEAYSIIWRRVSSSAGTPGLSTRNTLTRCIR